MRRAPEAISKPMVLSPLEADASQLVRIGKEVLKPVVKYFFAVLLLLFLVPKSVYAEEKINSFDTNIIAHQDGSMTIKESIEYDFGSAQRHGIFRTIPLVSKVGDLYRVIEVDFTDIKRDGNDERYEVDQRP